MINPKDLPRLFRSAEWATPEEVAAFVAEATGASASDVIKLLPLLQERALVTTAASHRMRCSAFALLAERVRSKELFAACVRALKPADPVLRAALAGLLPKINDPSSQQDLCDLLWEDDAELRQAVSRVLKLAASRTTVEALAVLVQSPEFPGRLEALEVLVPRAAQHAIPVLSVVLKIGSPRERAAAARWLGDAEAMARNRPGAFTALLPALDDPDERVLVQAIASSASVGAPADVLDRIGPKIHAGNPLVAKAVVDALRRLPSKQVVDLLAARLRLGPNVVRMAVLDALEAIATDDVMPALVNTLSHRQIVVRSKAADVISALALDGKVDVARTIMWLLRSTDVNVRRVAVEIVRKVGDPSGDLAPRLLRHLRDEDWWVREGVMDALVGMAGQRLTRHLVEYLKDPSDVIRRYAVGALIRVKDPRSLNALVQTAMDDEDWWVREQAVDAIGALGDVRALPYLVDLMNKAPQLRIPCAAAVRVLGSPQGAPQVAPFLSDPDPNVRLAVVQCLEALDDRTQAAALQPLAADPSPAVRRAVGEVLSRWSLVEGARHITLDESGSLLDRYLVAVFHGGSDDLLLAADRVPYVKRLGEMLPLEDRVLSAEEVKALLLPRLSVAQRQAVEALKDVDFSYEVKSHGLRFRSHVFAQMTGLAAVFRIVKSEIPHIEKLGLPPVVLTFGQLSNGLVLVGGPTGSGKSTTLAAIIDHVNRTQPRHIVTIEDPVEVLHTRKKSLINQREVGTHTRSFEGALRSILRQDPDVILVGEMRDLPTIAFAVTAAETGHLVLGTVHTVSADTSVDRLINVFPPNQQPQVRSMLADSLKAVICQNLLTRKDGKGRLLAVEVMLNNDAVSNLIRKGRSFQIPSVIMTSREQGMQSMDSELSRLVKEGLVHADDAFMRAIDKKAFEASLGSLRSESVTTPSASS